MKIVCIDCGHGGKDSGAVLGKRYEKNDVLKMGLSVKENLEKYGVKVVMTRATDMYDTPIEKARKGNKSECDLFLCLHRNASGSKLARGVESCVYSDKSDTVKLSKNILERLNSECEYENRGVKARKDLCVLNHTKMSAILLELGFISNDIDNLLFDKYFDKISKIIASEVKEFLETK
jgi:N-acetylmuramoyl-L-alanine amidase